MNIQHLSMFVCVLSKHFLIHQDHFAALRAAYPGSKLLIVSNTAGTRSFDADGAQAAQLERDTGVQVLPHNTKVFISFQPLTSSGLLHPIKTTSSLPWLHW